LSGYRRKKDRQHAGDAGIDYHKLKPTDLTAFLSLLWPLQSVWRSRKMWVIFRMQNRFAILGLGAALVAATGCNGEQSAIKIEPDTTSTKRTLEDVKKDLKPPVIITPNAPPITDTIPAAPKRESR
jgi:hypothetical protein